MLFFYTQAIVFVYRIYVWHIIGVIFFKNMFYITMHRPAKI